MGEPYQLEIFKSTLSLIVALLGLSGGWFIGNKLGLLWSLRQKKRELELTALNRLYELYGEFFAIWKLWDQSWKTDGKAPLPDQRWALLMRACAVEGAVEAFLLKLTTERPLDDDQLQLLGRFRQAFQILRERIRSNSRLHWGSSVPNEFPEYATFKHLTYRVACLLFDSPAILTRGTPPDSLSMLKVTSNYWEANWVDDADIRTLDERYKHWRNQASQQQASGRGPNAPRNLLP